MIRSCTSVMFIGRSGQQATTGGKKAFFPFVASPRFSKQTEGSSSGFGDIWALRLAILVWNQPHKHRGPLAPPTPATGHLAAHIPHQNGYAASIPS